VGIGNYKNGILQNGKMIGDWIQPKSRLIIYDIPRAGKGTIDHF